MKVAGRPAVVQELLDALVDVVAHRVAKQVEELSRPVEVPDRVPLWVTGLRACHTPLPEEQDEWTAEKILRSLGMVQHGEPGYEEGLQRHSRRWRADRAEANARRRLRKAVRLFERTVSG